MPNEPRNEESEVLRTLGSIEGKQDFILLRLDQQDKERQKLQAQVDGIDGRVSRVENRLSYAAGAIALLTAALVFFKEKLKFIFS